MGRVRIGVVGYCPPTRYDEDMALRYLEDAFDRIESDFPNKKIVVVSGGLNAGIPGQAYRLAVKRGYETAGVACEKIEGANVFPTTEEPVIVGKNWSDEIPVFVNGVKAIVDSEKKAKYHNHPHSGLDAIIKIGAGYQSIRETEMVRIQGKPAYEYDLPKLG